jgi:uncharacterized protein YggU (UPF0235/DUF167 family)
VTPAGVTLSECGVRFAVRVTPLGGKGAIGGWQNDAAGQRFLSLRVRAAAEDGKANEAVLELLKETLGVRRSALRLASGARGRVKLIEVEGDPAALSRMLAGLGADG